MSLSDGLLHWWCPTRDLVNQGLSATLADLAGANPAPISSGAAAWEVNTEKGGTWALRFAGGTDWAKPDPEINIETAPFNGPHTFCFWGQLDATTGTLIAMNGTGSGAFAYTAGSRGFESNILNEPAVSNTSANRRADGSFLTFGSEWRHIGFTHTGENVISVPSALKFYIDGSPYGFIAGSGIGTSAGFAIGGRGSSAGWKGLIDDTRMYNRALDASEMATLATARGIVDSGPAKQFHPLQGGNHPMAGNTHILGRPGIST